MSEQRERRHVEATSFGAMLSPRIIELTLLRLGFVPQVGRRPACFCSGWLQVDLLDGPRVLLTSPGGALRYVAVLSAQHLQEEITLFQASSAPVQGLIGVTS